MLKGENLIIRPLKIEDLNRTHEWRNNLNLIKLTQGIRFPKTMEMDKQWFENALNDTSNRNIYFGIDEIESSDFIGLMQLNNIDYISGTAIWGAIIGDKTKQRKGYGKEFSKLFLDYAFNCLNLRKITTYVVSYNMNAEKLFDSIVGFKEEGLLKEQFYFDGTYHDVIVFSLFRDDWFSNEK